MYVPVEVFELAAHPSWPKAMTLVANLGIVFYMAWLLWRARRPRQSSSP